MNPWRDDGVTTARCPLCTTPFTPTGRQQFCSHACRQTAYRRRHAAAASTLIPAASARRGITVYECENCEQRYYGQQWCPDCNRPCRRIGVGGLCPSCEAPVTVDDLTAQHPPITTHAVAHGTSA